MAYSRTWDETTPDGAADDADTLDTSIQDVKEDIRERLEDVFGMDMVTDPQLPTKFGPTVTVAGSQLHQSIYNAGNSGTSLTIDFSNGNFQKITLTGNCTLSVSNMKVGTSYGLFFHQDGTGGRTLTLPSELRTAGAAALTLNTTASRVTFISVVPVTTSVALVFLGGTNFNVS